MAKYTLLIYSDAKRWQDVGEDEMNAIMGEYFAYTQALREAGVYQGGEALQPVDTAKTVGQGGVVSDGPFAEVAEHLGGFYLIEVDGEERAVEWAAKLPGVDRGLDRIEVREVVEYPDA
jgi:hypothetical protein